MLKVAVGHSDDPSTIDAVEEILEQCRQELQGEIPQAGIVFAAIDFDHAELLQHINRTFPNLELIGCTTDGEMSSVLGFQQDSVTLMLFASDHITIRAGLGRQADQDPIAAARTAVQQAHRNSSQTPDLCIAIPASYTEGRSTTNGELILQGLGAALGDRVPILGGTAGDQFRFATSYQFFGTQVLTDALPILVFSGGLKVSHGIGCGWRPIGQKSRVTRAEGTVLYEIDGRPAIEFYQRYLGDRLPTAENPLAVYEDNSDRSYMRVPNLYNPETGGINFLGNIPEQAIVQVTDIYRDEVIDAANSAFETAMLEYPGDQPSAILLFSCCCRRWMLGTRAKEEYKLIEKSLPQKLPICGFYTYGEFSPLKTQGNNYYHQETFVVVLIGSDSGCESD
jgi:hypothetical protein